MSDLDWTDFEDCNPAAIDGYWQDGWTIDTIGLNACHFRDTLNDFDEKAVTTHEQGHALGINDHPAGWENVALMYGCAACTPFNTPQQHDKNDYFTLWP